MTREQWGEGFAQGANAIRITSGINKVIASGQIYWFENVGTSNSLITQTINRNQEQMALVNRKMGATGNYQTIPFGTIEFDVTEGDVISMTARNQNQANCTIGPNTANTWLQLIGLRVPTAN